MGTTTTSATAAAASLVPASTSMAHAMPGDQSISFQAHLKRAATAAAVAGAPVSANDSAGGAVGALRSQQQRGGGGGGVSMQQQLQEAALLKRSLHLQGSTVVSGAGAGFTSNSQQADAPQQGGAGKWVSSPSGWWQQQPKDGPGSPARSPRTVPPGVNPGGSPRDSPMAFSPMMVSPSPIRTGSWGQQLQGCGLGTPMQIPSSPASDISLGGGEAHRERNAMTPLSLLYIQVRNNGDSSDVWAGNSVG